MKKILMIKDGYLPDSRVEREALALKNAGYQIYLIYSEKAKGQINSVFEESYLIPLEIKARIYFPKAVNEVAKQYSSIIDKIKPDIIHAHDVMAANIACKVVPENVKFIYDDHEIWEIFTRSKIKKVKGLKQKILQIYIALATKKIVKKILKKADLLVVINEHWIDYYHKKGYPKENIIAIENYVDLNLINEVSKNEHLAEPFIQNDPRRKIIHSSNVQNLSQDINRNVNNIAQAAAELNDWVLIIYGNKDETLEKLGTMFFPQTDRIQYLVNCSKCDVALN
ncbi:MAG: glycosyltransferase family 4 protein, partial [Asgard group archaeon]|nr:glycosyltransferase family 4 protein [Asgard group archaeon]